MAGEFSSAGVLLKYAVETTAGTKPSSFTTIPNVYSIPSFNDTPNELDVTDLSDPKYMRSIPGLIPTGGVKGFGAHHSAALRTAWDALVTAYETGKASNKATWFEIYIPNDEGYFFTGHPCEYSLDDLSVDAVINTTLYIAVDQREGFDTLI